MYRPLLIAVPALAGVAFVAMQGSDVSSFAEAAAQANSIAWSGDAVTDCVRLTDVKVDISEQRSFHKYQQDWKGTCLKAIAVAPANVRVQVGLARAHSSLGEKDDSLQLLRKAMAAGDAEAAWEIFETHKSFSRGNLDRVPYVTRAEGEAALRRAAELGHPAATLRLVGLLSRGPIVKRDKAEAIRWAEIAVTRPFEYNTPAVMQAMLGGLLLKSDKLEDQQRGMALLQANIGQYGVKTTLAKFYRTSNPERARALLEEALRPDPGGATPPLAEMLIKGEGGPADEKRGVRMLVNGSREVPGVSLARGRMYAEGKYVERDMAKAIDLIHHDAAWHHESRMELFDLLAANPTIKVVRPQGLLYDAVEAAELGEPGAMISLIKIKLSDHVQFTDKAGGCALARKTAEAGDAEAGKLAEGCG